MKLMLNINYSPILEILRNETYAVPLKLDIIFKATENNQKFLNNLVSSSAVLNAFW